MPAEMAARVGEGHWATGAVREIPCVLPYRTKQWLTICWWWQWAKFFSCQFTTTIAICYHSDFFSQRNCNMAVTCHAIHSWETLCSCFLGIWGQRNIQRELVGFLFYKFIKTKIFCLVICNKNSYSAKPNNRVNYSAVFEQICEVYLQIC